jgi:hypothetical protein
VSSGQPDTSDGVTIPYSVTDELGFLAAHGIPGIGELYWANGSSPIGDPIKTFLLDVTAGQHEQVFTGADFAGIAPRPAEATGVVVKLKLDTPFLKESDEGDNTWAAWVPLPDLVAGPFDSTGDPVLKYTVVRQPRRPRLPRRGHGGFAPDDSRRGRSAHGRLAAVGSRHPIG